MYVRCAHVEYINEKYPSPLGLPNNCHLRENYEAQGRAGEAIDDTEVYDAENIRFASRAIKIIIRT